MATETMFQTLIDSRDDMYPIFVNFYNGVPDNVVDRNDIIMMWNNRILIERQPDVYDLEDGEILSF